jgi:putative ABC transport system permease protein
MFQLLGVQPLVGRTFQADDYRTGNGRVLVLSYRLWQRRFGGDPNVVGQSLLFSGESYMVVGVMPPQFQFAPFWATKSEIWAPLDLTARATQRGGSSLRIFARLKPGVSGAQAQAEMDAICRRLEQAYPDTNTGRTVRVDPLLEKVVGNLRPALRVLVGAVVFVLLIACANVANLLLVRAAARQKEMAIRAALGASRWRTIRQLLTESVVLAAIAGALGLLLGFWGVESIKGLLAGDATPFRVRMPRVTEITIDSATLMFTLWRRCSREWSSDWPRRCKPRGQDCRAR